MAARVAIVRTGWLYAGGDSYGYVSIADEWRLRRRLAFGPPPQELQWYRRPLYPWFVSAVKGAAPANVSGGAGWRRIQIGQLAIEGLLLWPLLYLTARRRAGPLAALIALALAALFPPALLYPLAALTESIAMSLALLAVVPLVWLEASESYAPWCIAAIGLALSALLRPDGVLWAVAILPVVMLGKTSRRMKLRGVAAYSLLFALVFLPWPLRNLAHFGKPHVSDGMIDRFGVDIPEYRGYWDWMRTWSRDEKAAAYPSSCFYDSFCETTAGLFEELSAFAAPATDADLERAKVEDILARRKRFGVSAAISADFEELAQARLRAHPWRVLVWLPLRRAMRAWWAAPDELAQHSERWPASLQRIVPHFRKFGRALYLASLAALLVLLWTPAYRFTGLVLVVPLIFRSLILGWTAFSLPRYVAPGYPLCYLLIGIGIAVLARRVRGLAVKPA